MISTSTNKMGPGVWFKVKKRHFSTKFFVRTFKAI